MNSKDDFQTSNRLDVIPNDTKDKMKEVNGHPASVRPDIDIYDLSFWVNAAITVFAAGVVLGVLISRKD